VEAAGPVFDVRGAKRHQSKRAPDADDRTIISTRPKTGMGATANTAAVTAAGTQRGYRFGLIVFGSLSVLLIALTAGLVTIHILTGGRSNFSEEVLDAPLVAVEEPEAIELQPAQGGDEMDRYLPPRIVELSGDPIFVRRQGTISRQLVKLPDEVTVLAKPLKLAGDVYRFTDTLSAPKSDLPGGFQGSQQDFAFDQSEDASVSASEVTTGSEEGVAPGLDGNANILIVNPEGQLGAQTAQEFVGKAGSAPTVWKFLAGLGFSEESAKAAGAAVQGVLGVERISANDDIAVLGINDDADAGKLVPAQIAIYRDSRFLGSIALTENQAYAASVDPWNGAPPEMKTEDAGGSVVKERLLDAIYSTAVRSKLPTPVIGEALLLLSRSNDLEQAAAIGDGVIILYTTAPRDAKTGFGRILYVRISRGAGDMECYAVQVKAGKPFDCVSFDGQDKSSGGMISPVKGVIVARFGPRIDPQTGKKTDQMNFGVDWAAPLGSRVVAAFDGEVETADYDSERGNFVRLTHPGNSKTVYTQLQKFAADLAPGMKVSAGQVIGYVGKSGNASDPVLHFELLRNNRPVDPFGEFQSQVEKGGAIDVFVNRIIYIESGNNCKAANPLSSAVGLGQFLKSTWMLTIGRHRPDLLKGRTREEVLALRTDCDLAREMTTAFTRDNATVLRSQGAPVTPGNLYLAHFLGADGALQVLNADPKTMIAEMFGEAHVAANPHERAQNVGFLVDWAARKMQRGKTVVAAAPSSPAPPKKVVSSKAFAELKQAVDIMLK
jgi:murein DD-endopeptidase MepM/ murein hydrolase activator NlpD